MNKHQLLKNLLLPCFLIHLSSVCISQVAVFNWKASYEGPSGASGNFTSDMVVDGAGNVYVTGNSYYGTTVFEADIATVKYNAAGVQQWEARYNGTGNQIDLANAIAVDGSGNVYITGETYSSSGNVDYVTIKYNASGVQQWIAIYDGPSGQDDKASGLAIDGSGNTYVTGKSGGVGTYDDCTTIKYNSAGVQQWVARYNGAAGGNDIGRKIAFDAFGNIIVAGESRTFAGFYDILTIKYNSAGIQQWVRNYDGQGHDEDYAWCLVTDAAGNIVVAGRVRGTSSGLDYIVLKYSPLGIILCSPIYNGPGNGNDFLIAAALDQAGNMYVTGTSPNADGNTDYATIKYNSAGIQQWVARYNGPLNYYDEARALALDNYGNAYVTGLSRNAPYNDDYTTIKYNSAGVPQWNVKYDGWVYDNPAAIVVDPLNQVYVTGSSVIAPRQYAYVTVRYSQVTLHPPGAPPVATWQPDQNNAAIFRISNFPNPVSNTSRIQYELPFDGQVSIKVFDVLGREITTLVNSDMQAGIRSTEFNASSLKNGIYYYTVTVKNEKKIMKRTGKITVVK